MQVRIICDNSKCAKDVDKFVLKWFQKTTNRDILEFKTGQPGVESLSEPLLRFDFLGIKSG